MQRFGSFRGLRLLPLAAFLLCVLSVQSGAQSNTQYFQNLVANPVTGQMDATYYTPGDAGPTDSARNASGNGTYENGVIPNAKICVVLAGNWWNQNPAAKSQVLTAIQQAIGSPYYQNVSEYQCGTSISYGGYYVDTGGGAAESPGTFGDGDIYNLVGYNAVQQFLPVPNGPFPPNNVYVVFTPPGASNPAAPTGYHSFSNNLSVLEWEVVHLVYANVPYTNITQMMQVFSHETVEAMTDPYPTSGNGPFAWIMDRQFGGTQNTFEGELSDAASGLFDTENNQSVEAYWDQGVKACAIPYGSSFQLSGNSMTSYYNSSDQTVHEFYVGTDQHVHELYWTGSAWGQTDQTSHLGCPNVLGGSSLTSVFFSGQSHVFFIGSDRLVHEIYNTGGSSWFNGGITSADTIPCSITVGDAKALTCCFSSLDNSLHVFFANSNSSGLVDLYISSSSGGWQENPFTAGPNAPGLGPSHSSELTCSCGSSGNPYVFYIGPDGHLKAAIQGQISPGHFGWIENDWTNSSGDSTVAQQDAVTCLYDGFAVQAAFIGTDNCVHEIVQFANGKFNKYNASTISHSPSGAGNALASYWDGAYGHFINRTTDNRIQEFQEAPIPSLNVNSWLNYNDLTTSGSAPLSFPSRSLTGSYDLFHNAELVLYLANDQNQAGAGDVGAFFNSPRSNFTWLRYSTLPNIQAGSPLAVP